MGQSENMIGTLCEGSNNNYKYIFGILLQLNHRLMLDGMFAVIGSDDSQFKVFMKLINLIKYSFSSRCVLQWTSWIRNHGKRLRRN